MTVTYIENMNFNPAVKFKHSRKSNVVYNYSPKTSKEFIAPPSLNKEYFATFQKSMKFIILIGQCFGLIPVLGIWENDSSKLRFTYYCGRTIYSFISVIGQFLLVLFCTLKIIRETDSSLSSNTTVVFYGSNCLVTVLFIKIARKWPRLCRHIAKIESIDPNTDNTIVTKCNLTWIIILGFAAVEHTLADVSGMSLAAACQPDKSPYEAFLRQNFYWIWNIIPYNNFLAALSKFFNIQCTFNWSYSDSFIICICWYLTARLHQVNDRLQAVRGQYMSSTFWRTMREDYTKVTSLIRIVDEIIGGVIFISFASNLFSICLLILHILEDGIQPVPPCNVTSYEKPMNGYEHASYFIFAIAFLLFRSLAMCLIAARVQTASAEPAQVLYDVPPAAYCIEVQRFLDQVHGDTVVLSGLQFFSVTRGMVLTIAATIITYELVLIQFAEVSPTAAANILAPDNVTVTT